VDNPESRIVARPSFGSVRITVSRGSGSKIFGKHIQYTDLVIAPMPWIFCEPSYSRSEGVLSPGKKQGARHRCIALFFSG